MVTWEECEYIPEEVIKGKALKRLCICETPDHQLAFEYFNDPSLEAEYPIRNYNRTWRLWTGIPTVEQMAAVPWNKIVVW